MSRTVYILCNDWTDVDGSVGRDLEQAFASRDAAEREVTKRTEEQKERSARRPGGATAWYYIEELEMTP